MENDHTTMLFLIMGGGTLLLATEVRAVTRNLVSHLELQVFLLEMLATFQLCACFGMLHPLAQMENHAQLYLGHLYSFLTMHFLLTLSESVSNPTCILLDILQKGISMKEGGLKIVAQFIGAFLAKLYQNAVWFVGISNLFPHPQECSNPLKTYFLKALCTELVTSITFQFTVLESQSQEIRVRANVLSLAITSLVYAGLLPLLSLVCKNGWQGYMCETYTMLLLLFSRVRLFVTPWTRTCQALLSSTASRSLVKLMLVALRTLSNHLVLCRPLLLVPSIFPNIRVFSREFSLLMRWPKYWSLSFRICPSSEHSGLISLRMVRFDLLSVQTSTFLRKSALSAHWKDRS
uniref:Uncharacterized protein n=1 Tax=Podarcis muralis TaxID=64176 RepID=A0A670HR34_PODMU